MYVQLLVLGVIRCLDDYLSTMGELEYIFDQIDQDLLHPYMITNELIRQIFFSVIILT